MICTRLRDCGLKATRPRQLVLQAFEQLGGHRSVDDVVEWLRTSGQPLQRGSVYGVVEALVDKGLLKLADAGPGRALYEMPQKDHHHFICQDCNAILDVELPQGFPLARATRRGLDHSGPNRFPWPLPGLPTLS